MKTYELTYIISPEITSEEAEAKAKEIEAGILSREGTALRQSNPVAKTLSYPIKKHASGFLGSLEFQLEPEKLIELKEMLVKDGKIARHMIIIKEPAKPRKERRTRIKPESMFGIEPPLTKPATDKQKVELKDIEQKLDELLGE